MTDVSNLLTLAQKIAIKGQENIARYARTQAAATQAQEAEIRKLFDQYASLQKEVEVLKAHGGNGTEVDPEPPPDPEDPPPPPDPGPFGALLPAPLAPSQGNGGTIYIAPNGSDTTGNGTIGNPYKSPHKAFSVVNLNGGLILCRGGTYNLAGLGEAGIQSTWNRLGNTNNPPQIRAYPGEAPVFSGHRILVHNASASCGGLRFGPGIRVTGAPIFSGSRLDGIKVERSLGYVEIVGCEIDNNTGNGFLSGYTSTLNPTQVQILNCKFHHNGDASSGHYHGIYWGHSDATCLVANCVFWDNAAFAIQCGPAANNTIVTCCTNYGQLGPSGGSAGVSIWSQSPERNFRTRIFGFIVSQVTYAFAYSFSGLGSSDDPQIHDSIWWNAPAGIEPQSGLTTSNIVHADPKFKNASTRDLRLAAGSPAIGLIPSSHYGYVPPFDILGNPRVTADAGAYAKES